MALDLAAGERRLAEALRPGVVSVVRLPPGLDPVPAALEVASAGVRAVEITLTADGALDAIARLVSADSGALVGAGSVRTPAEVRAAVDAGAGFLVTPTTRPDVIREACRLGVPVVAGGLTPTELDIAREGGASHQKVFPASAVTASYVREVLAPMPDLRLVPTGGVTVDNVPQWRAAGAVAVAVGSALVDAATVRSGERAILSARTRDLLAAWERGHGG
jgi:2-dehydro-3-deoxyphosphogluconate aldolase/(4S)-4-hydroxy-2-oxoglutarate aldolase